MMSARFALVATLVVGCSASAMQPLPPPQPASRVEPHRRYAALLDRYMSIAGRIDYAAWHASTAHVAELDAYVQHLLEGPPENTEAERLAYWLNLYNAVSIREILRRWPLDAVDERAMLAEVSFEVGGETLTLAEVEMRLVRNVFADPRAHFAMTCGARSCPLLPRSPFDGFDLEKRLERAARAFINRPDQVRVDHEKARIFVSAVFGWYRADFVRAAKQRLHHPAPTVVDYLRMYAAPALDDALAQAQRGRYRVELLPYDWSLRDDLRGIVPTDEAALVTSDIGPYPDVEIEGVDGTPFTAQDLMGQVTIVDFWATWCRPCLLSFPLYANLLLEHEKRGLRVVAVAQDEGRAPVDAFVEANAVAIDIAFDADRRLSLALSVTTLPTVLLVDREGRIRLRLEGYDGSRHAQLEARIHELLDEHTP